MIKCEELMQKDYFDTYSEFYLALCFAAECMRRGDRLDMSHMRIEKDILPAECLDYFKYLLYKDAIYIEGIEPVTSFPKEEEKVALFFNVSCITDLQEKLVQNTPERYYWSYDYAMSAYDIHQSTMLKLSKLGTILMHIIAHVTLRIFLGEIERKPIVVEFDDLRSKTSQFYVNLYSCARSMDWFGNLVNVNVDFGKAKVDINYSIHYNNGRVAGRHKKWSIQEKKEFMKKLGMVEGSILMLAQRNHICDSNPAGRVTSAVIVRLDEIGRDFVGVTTMPLNKTVEEIRRDYFDIPEEKRYLFIDMLTQKPVLNTCMIPTYELGIDNYFLDETKFILKLDKRERVMKRVTIDGKEGDVSMSGVDAIYWLLCQYSIDFDRELYKSMYNDGKDLMWDLYGNELEE